ncbi:MAG TPA: hypothetical protein VGC35_02880 [Allosphingosinicella sp.]|jgi:hypothetical protein
MSTQHDFYLARAAEARAEAEAATLENAKARAFRAQAAWNAMARRSAATEQRRADKSASEATAQESAA